MANEFSIDMIKFNIVANKLREKHIDANDNGKIDAEEKDQYVSLLDELKNNSEITDEEYNQEISIFNEAFGIPQDDAPVGDEFKSSQNVSVPEIKGTRKAFNKDLKEHFSWGETIDEAVEKLSTTSYAAPGCAETVAMVKKMVSDIKALNPQTKEDIRNVRKKQYDYPIKYRTLYNTLVDQTKAELKQAHVNEMIEEYQEIKEENTDQNGEVNFTNTYNSAIEQANTENKREYTSSEKKMFKKYVIADAQQHVYAEMDGMDAHSGKKLRREILDKNEDDKLERKAVRKSKHDSEINGYIHKANDREEKMKVVSEDEIINGIKNDSSKGDNSSKSSSALGTDLFRKIARTGKFQNADGTYDLSEIYNIVKTRVGADANANRSQDTQAAEMEWVKKDLRALGLNDLSDDDVRRIIRLCGFHVEERNHTPKCCSGIALANALLQEYEAFILETTPLTVEAVQTVIVKTIGETSVNVIQEVVDGSIQAPGMHVAAIANLVLALIGIAIGEDKAFETSCISSTDFDVNDPKYQKFDSFTKYIKEAYPDNPRKASAWIMLASMFSDDEGNIDWGKLESFKNKYAGKGSNLNCDELKRMTFENKKEEKPDDGSVLLFEKDENVPYETEETVVQEVNVPVIDARNSGWKELVATYGNCFKEKFGDNRRRVLKLVQGIKDNNYSKERIDYLLSLNTEALKNEPGFDFAVYNSFLNGESFTMVKLPDDIAGCSRNKTMSIKAKPQVKKNNNSGTSSKTKKRKTKKAMAPAKDTVTVKNKKQNVKQERRYYARFNYGPEQKYNNANDRKREVDNYQKKNPKAPVKHCTSEAEFKNAKKENKK